LLVEFWEPARPAAADRARTESVASFVSTVVAEACRDGGRTITVQWIAKRPRRFDGFTSSALLQEVRRALAAVEPVADDDLPAVVDGLTTEERQRANIIIVSTRAVDLEDEDRFSRRGQRSDLQARRTPFLGLWPTNPYWSQIFREADA
jgi:hypothetical protein